MAGKRWVWSGFGLAVVASVACGKGGDAPPAGAVPVVMPSVPGAGGGAPSTGAPGAAPGTPSGSVRTPSPMAATGCPATDAANAAMPGTVHNDGIDGAETLTLAGSPHRFPEGAVVHANAVLTIEPCARIVVGDGYSVRVETAGTLVANGDAEHPILFESGAPTPVRGVWTGLVFQSGTRPNTSLKYVVVEDAGPTGEGSGAIRLEDQVSVLLDHVRVVRSGRHGLHLYAGARLAAGSAEITVAESGVDSELSGAVYAYDANSVGSLPELHFEGNVNDEVIVETAEVTTTATWRALGAGHRYRLLNGLRVAGPSSPVLTVAAGTTLAFAPGQSFIVGDGADGAVVLDGAAEETRIVLTSARPVPAPADWGGVLFGEQVARAATKLSYVTVDFAGAPDMNDDGGCDGAAPAAVTILGRDLGGHLDHVRVLHLEPPAVGLARGFAAAEPTDYAASALGNEWAGGGRCGQTTPRDAEGNCPDPVPPCR